MNAIFRKIVVIAFLFIFVPLFASTLWGFPPAAKAALAAASKKGVFVVRSSRTGSCMVARNGEVNDDALGFIAADNLNSQKARILLMLALTATQDAKVIQQYFDTY